MTHRHGYSLLASLLLVTSAIAAPIPRPKPCPRPNPCGSWTAYWSGAEWPTIMLADSSYVAERPGGPRYEGRWSLQGDVLKIEERLISPYGDGELYHYSFTLRRGSLNSICGGLRLKRVD